MLHKMALKRAWKSEAVLESQYGIMQYSQWPELAVFDFL